MRQLFINHSKLTREICQTISEKATADVTKMELQNPLHAFYRKFIHTEPTKASNTTMDNILRDINNPRGYKPSIFQQKCFNVFIRMTAPLIFSQHKNNVAEYAKLMKRYDIKPTKKRLALMETGRRMGKSQGLKLFACSVAKNMPGVRIIYVSKDPDICKADYEETLSFARAVGATIFNIENEIWFYDTCSRKMSYIKFKPGCTADVSCCYFFFVYYFFFRKAATFRYFIFLTISSSSSSIVDTCSTKLINWNSQSSSRSACQSSVDLDT